MKSKDEMAEERIRYEFQEEQRQVVQSSEKTAQEKINIDIYNVSQLDQYIMLQKKE